MGATKIPYLDKVWNPEAVGWWRQSALSRRRGLARVGASGAAVRYAGLDPASFCGCVIVDEAGKLVARMTSHPSPKLDMPSRLWQMQGEVEGFLNTFQPDRVGYETLREYLAKDATVRTFGIQARFVGVVEAAIAAYGRPVVEQAPPCVRGRGRNRIVTGLVTGDVARARLRLVWGAVADELTTHEVDAAIIARKVAGLS
jgi:hypothetical protein